MIKKHSNATTRTLIVCLIVVLLISVLTAPVAASSNSEFTENTAGGVGDKKNDIDENFNFQDFANFDLGEVIKKADEEAEKELSGLRLGIYHITKWFKIGPSALTTLAASTVITGSQVVQENQGWAKDFGDAFLVIGRLFCVLYFLLSLMDAASRDSFTIDAFVKSLAKLVIIFIIFSPDTLQKITYFARAIEYKTLQVIANATIEGATANGLIEHVANVKDAQLWGLGVLLSMDSLAAVTNISALVVAACISISRAVEILAYQTFLPLAMGSLYDGGLRSPGMRYIKKWMALYLQGAVIIVVAALVSKLSSEALFPSLGITLVIDIAYALVVISLLTKSKSIANDIMGV